jgi:hypothetical protein
MDNTADTSTNLGQQQQPTTRSGDAAKWLSGLALFALVTSALLAQFINDIPHVLRLAIVGVFTVCGVGGFVAAGRALMLQDRRASVWAAFVVGLAATLLTVAEFTIME